MKISAHRKTSGFTLVELLIVIAVIGVLAAVILAVINPLQQLARGRDTGRISTVAQLGSALQRYATTNVNYLAVPAAPGPATFMTDLVTANEIQAIFTNPAYGIGFTAGCTAELNQGNYCYDMDVNGAVVYARAESNVNNDLCIGANDTAWIVWSSAAGRSGIVCTADEATLPQPGVTTFAN